MKTLVSAVLGIFMLVSFSGLAFAAKAGEKTDIGKSEYQANCANCHGVGGKGDGPIADLLTKKATDLTMLTKSNGGVFPIARIYEVIDGTKAVKIHGSRDMPVWGQEYSVRAAEYYRDVDYDPEVYVRARILTLIDYIHRLQSK